MYNDVIYLLVRTDSTKKWEKIGWDVRYLFLWVT